MRVFILRHAEAVDNAASDFERELTPHGIEQSKRVAKFMKAEALLPQLILASPYLRTVQTAKLVANGLGLDAPVEEERLGCGMSPETALGLLRAHSTSFSSIMLVGHQPDLGEVMDALLGVTGTGGSMHVRKATLASFWLHRISAGGGTLELFVPAKYLKL